MADDTKDPELEPDTIDRVYEALAELQVELDADPLTFGPKRLNGKIADSRAKAARCEEIYLQVAHDLHRFTRAHRSAEAQLRLSKDHLFANDPETRSGRNVADRESIATMKLKPLVERNYKLRAAMEDLQAVLIVVKAKRADLRDIQGRLRDQIRLCQEERELGGIWGSQKKGAPPLQPTVPAPDLKALDAIVGGIDGEIHLNQASGDFDRPDKTAWTVQSPVHPDTFAPEPAKDPEAPAAEPKAPVGLTDLVAQARPIILDDDEEETEEEEDLVPLIEEDETEGTVSFDAIHDKGHVHEALPPTASTSEVEDFLANFDVPGPKNVGDADKGMDAELENLLASFG